MNESIWEYYDRAFYIFNTNCTCILSHKTYVISLVQVNFLMCALLLCLNDHDHYGNVKRTTLQRIKE